MTIDNIIVGDRVLVQTDEFTKETAKVKAIINDGAVVVMYTNGRFAEVSPQYILKSFGQP